MFLSEDWGTVPGLWVQYPNRGVWYLDWGCGAWIGGTVPGWGYNTPIGVTCTTVYFRCTTVCHIVPLGTTV